MQAQGRTTTNWLLASLAGLAALTAAGVSPALAVDAVYTVGNYPVDAEAANAVAAKKKALADGQEAAFRSLLKRVVPVTAYDRLKRLDNLRSSSFFEGVSVRSERNSFTRYIASLDFSFRPESVRAILNQEGIPFVEEQAREIIIVPIVRRPDGSADTGAAARAWTDIWKSLDLDHTLTPIALKGVKPQIHADTINMLVSGNGSGDRILSTEYGEPYVVAAIAEPDAATKRLNVTLAGADAVGPFYLKRSYRVYNGDTAYAMEFAAVVAQGILEGRWKARKSATNSVAQGPLVAIRASYQTLGQWRQMREVLLALPNVGDLRIEAETARGASLSLRYPGGPSALAATLYGRGLTLESGAGGLVLRSRY